MALEKRQHPRTYNTPGHAHELTFSCFNRLPLLNAERTLQWLAQSINTAKTILQLDIWAYVFMPEHVHLLVHPRGSNYDMSAIRRAIKEPVGRRAIAYLRKNSPRYLPRLTRRRGDREERLFWQSGGGYDRNITSSESLFAAVDYIHLNPVRRGLVERASAWRWSSAGWFESKTASPVEMDLIPPEWLDDRAG
jgi:putative transposase